MRIPIGKGIAGHVASTGKLLNIRDAYNDPLFYRGIDEATGFKTKNILCFPIRDENGIVGKLKFIFYLQNILLQLKSIEELYKKHKIFIFRGGSTLQ